MIGALALGLGSFVALFALERRTRFWVVSAIVAWTVVLVAGFVNIALIVAASPP